MCIDIDLLSNHNGVTNMSACYYFCK
jgi:hypothetical protein